MALAARARRPVLHDKTADKTAGGTDKSTPRSTEKVAEKTPAQSRVRDEARALYRKAILDAAEEVFSERGVTAARVQDIAARAGLAVGTIYNHFEQKEDVLVALLGERTSGFLESFAAQPADGGSFEERLVARTTRLLAYVESHRPFFQLASDHGLLGAPTTLSAEKLLGGKQVPHAGRFDEDILRVVDEGLDAGVIGGAPRAVLALQLRHSIRTGSLCVRAKPERSEGTPDEIARWVVALFLYGASRQAHPANGARRRAR